MDLTHFSILTLFFVGYGGIIFEHLLKMNKTGVALLTAVICWTIYFCNSAQPLDQDLAILTTHLSEIAQILFFLMGAMTLVELIDAHRGFKFITDTIGTSSKRKLLWIVAGTTFFLSAVLDNLTTTILMISLIRKLVPSQKERFLLVCAIVVAANAGGAWTPIGDVTTTMLWIHGQLSSLAVMKALFIPSLVSMLFPLFYFHYRMKGRYPHVVQPEKAPEPGAMVVFALGIGGLICVPVIKALTGLPPFMAILAALGLLWLVTDLMHHPYKNREHLRIPHILTRIDTSGILFFLGILLAVDALDTAGFLKNAAAWLGSHLPNLPLVVTLIGIVSAVIDNVPLVAATMSMYPLPVYPIDHPLWHMIAYAAGTGGSILIIGSSAGVAMMGIEKVDFLTYLKRASLPILLGYLAGMLVYLL